jgi:transposase
VSSYVLGVDISKATFNACLRATDGKQYQRVFDNDKSGFKLLAKWLRDQADNTTPVCMEATGTYWRALASDLYGRGLTVHVVNPKFIKHYGISMAVRTKNDRADARLIARFCEHERLPAWAPPSPAMAQLQGLVRRRHQITKMRTQEANRLEDPAGTSVRRSLKSLVSHLRRCIDSLDNQIQQLIRSTPELRHSYDLLITIPGFGPVAAATLIAEIGDLDRFPTARDLAAHSGIVSADHDSGTSVKGKPRMCRLGSDHLRSAVYMPALSLMNSKGPFGNLARRVKARSNEKMVAVVAVMHKLLRVAYGVLKHQQPFNPALLASEP